MQRFYSNNMKIYINDIPVKIKGEDRVSEKNFDVIISKQDDISLLSKLKGKVLIRDKSVEAIDQLLRIMTEKKYKKIKQIEIRVKSKKETIHYLKTKFTVIEAAGGIVEKEGKILLILRNDLWDIPKGKIELGENIETAAMREIVEETGVQVSINEKICTSWHTYIRNDKYVLKKTYWYRMQCEDDTKMTPQKEENIQKTIWMTPSEVDLAMHHSFKTIKRVVKKYRKSIAE